MRWVFVGYLCAFRRVSCRNPTWASGPGPPVDFAVMFVGMNASGRRGNCKKFPGFIFFSSIFSQKFRIVLSWIHSCEIILCILYICPVTSKVFCTGHSWNACNRQLTIWSLMMSKSVIQSSETIFTTSCCCLPLPATVLPLICTIDLSQTRYFRGFDPYGLWFDLGLTVAWTFTGTSSFVNSCTDCLLKKDDAYYQACFNLSGLLTGAFRL